MYSCCLLGRISVIRSGRAELPENARGTGNTPGQGSSRSSTDSWTAVERSVSVKVPDEFTELLDSTPNGKWTIMDDGTPYIVYQGTTFMDPKGASPGWKWRTTMLGEEGSEWSIMKLFFTHHLDLVNFMLLFLLALRVKVKLNPLMLSTC